MANVLKAAMKHAIATLLERGRSQRAVARELGVSRKTVGRYVRLAREGESKEAIPTTGSGCAGEGAKGAIPTAGAAGRRSDCEPFRESIEEKVALGLSAQRIWQDLQEASDSAPGYESVKRFVRQFGARAEHPFRRMESPPGREAQVDFGKGAPVVGEDGKRTRPHLFRMVLSHSGAGYSEVVRKQDTETFIRCIENAFLHFGGVTETLVTDNLKAAVTKADWYDPDINPKMREFCEHCGTVPLPTKPRMPRHKGKVEKSVDYVQQNALKGRTFASLVEQNQFLADWEERVADTRIHGTTRRQVRKALEAEREYLAPLPEGLFPCFREAQRKVNRDGHVEVDHAYYSVPPEFARTTVWVRWDGRFVRIFDLRLREVAVHPASEPGRFSTLTGHVSKRKISSLERGEGWMMGKLRLVGPRTEAWARAVMVNRGIEGLRVLQGLLALVGKHNGDDIEVACQRGLQAQNFRLKGIREALKEPRSQPLLFADRHPLIRPVGEYGLLAPFPAPEGGV
ncbi:MAG: IS21 family transposase [Victivallales bacterium]|nr:IS21 family transposase [Victivallales bacterium]